MAHEKEPSMHSVGRDKEPSETIHDLIEKEEPVKVFVQQDDALGFIAPPPIIEVEREGSGHKKSIKGMSNLIHEEIANEDEKKASFGPDDDLKR